MSADLEQKAPPSRATSSALRRLLESRMALLSAGILFVLLLGSILVPILSAWRYDRADLALGPTPPSFTHWMGTDYFGRDLAARIFFGGRVSFAVGFFAALLSLVIGVSWGGISGYFGGRIDALLMRIVDVLYTIPFLIFVILVMVFFGGDGGALDRIFRAGIGLFVAHPEDPSYKPVFQIVLVIFALSAMSWMTMARIVRGQVLSLKNRPFIEAVRTTGAGHAHIIFRHLVPNAIGPVIVYATLMVPEIMMTEAFLSFLGLGTQEPLSSWGLLAATGAETMDLYPWQIVFPALMLAITLFCFNYLGDGLRDALDPKAAKG